MHDASETIQYGNDEGILWIRKNYPQCPFRNEDLGAWIWIFLRDNSLAEQLTERRCEWGDVGEFIGPHRLPKTAMQFKLRLSALPALFEYLKRLGEGTH